MAGFKIGALSCLATGTLGYFSGKAVQKRVNQLPNIDTMIEDTMIENTPSTDQSASSPESYDVPNSEGAKT